MCSGEARAAGVLLAGTGWGKPLGWRRGLSQLPLPDTPKNVAHAAVQRGHLGGQRVVGLSEEGAGFSSHIAAALLSLLQDICAGHWIFHPVLPDDVAGRAVLSQTPGGFTLHHPH